MKSVALALTWDGARWPANKLPVKARAFLAGKTATSKAMARLFSDDKIRELRICWVPGFKGGTNVLSEPFSTLEEKRVSFKTVKMIYFGDILGVIYQRSSA